LIYIPGGQLYTISCPPVIAPVASNKIQICNFLFSVYLLPVLLIFVLFYSFAEADDILKEYLIQEETFHEEAVEPSSPQIDDTAALAVFSEQKGTPPRF